MDWERKFYDIVRETETNLDNARRKLQGRYVVNETHSHNEYIIKPRSSLDTGAKSSSAPASGVHRRDDVNWWKHDVSHARHHLGLVGQPLTNPSTSTSGNTAHGSEIRELLDKIDAQNLVIQKLERLVRTLDTEREQYRRQLRDLTSEVGNMSTRINTAHSSDPHVEVQLDLMRREVKSEIQRLQSMLNTTRTSTLYSGVMERSLRDMKDNVYGEMDDLRKDLSSISERVGRLELDVSTQGASQRGYQNRTRLDTSYTSRAPLDTSFRSAYGPSSGMHELRTTVSALHDKLDRLESRLAVSRAVTTAIPLLSPGLNSTTFQSQTSKPYRSTAVPEFDEFDSKSMNSSDLDNLDLSEDLDLSEELDNAGVLDSDDDDAPLVEDYTEKIVWTGKKKKTGDHPLGTRTLDSVVKLNKTTSAIQPSSKTVDAFFDNGSSVDPESDSVDLSGFDLDSLGGDSGEVKLDDL
ncbi:hypothetical protein BaRGS_00004809 [Batillaria attramentaria]|uniref:Uncharacterized protein n=1 Tax=Batillaria attramentaria TaxID=370345 RepID=A0ABD0LX43_9CAEN